MDFALFISGTIDFLKLLVIVSVISFVLYKIFSPIRERIAEKFSFSWVKSALALNFAGIFIIIFGMYIFFMLVGITSAPEIDPELSYNVVDYAYQIFFALPRIFIATLIVSLLLLFFEFLGSFFLANEEEKRGKGKSSPWISQFVGIAFTCAIFLLLFLFVFNWVPFGLFLYIFYGTISPLPAIILF